MSSQYSPCDRTPFARLLETVDKAAKFDNRQRNLLKKSNRAQRSTAASCAGSIPSALGRQTPPAGANQGVGLLIDAGRLVELREQFNLMSSSLRPFYESPSSLLSASERCETQALIIEMDSLLRALEAALILQEGRATRSAEPQ